MGQRESCQTPINIEEAKHSAENQVCRFLWQLRFEASIRRFTLHLKPLKLCFGWYLFPAHTTTNKCRTVPKCAKRCRLNSAPGNKFARIMARAWTEPATSRTKPQRCGNRTTSPAVFRHISIRTDKTDIVMAMTEVPRCFVFLDRHCAAGCGLDAAVLDIVEILP